MYNHLDMPWNAKTTELLIATLIGAVGTLLVTSLKGLWSRFWSWWDCRQAIGAELHHFARQIESTDSARQLSEILVELKAFLVQYDALLKRATVKRFFDDWLKDVLLDATGEHPKLMISENREAKKQLKADAAALLK
jgi:hypothetical protein